VIADRKLSGGSNPPDISKITVVAWPGTRMLCTFTGLASVQGVDTLVWASEQLAALTGTPGSLVPTPWAAAQLLEKRGTAVIRTLPVALARRRLTFAMAGFVGRPHEVQTGVFGNVSNFQRGSGPLADEQVMPRALAEFQARMLNLSCVDVAEPRWLTNTYGASEFVEPRDRKRLDHMLARGCGPRDYIARAAQMIRRAANRSSGTIGHDLMATVIPAVGEFWTTFQPDSPDPFAFAPNQTYLTMAGGAVLVDGWQLSSEHQIITYPWHVRNDPCQCGSGLKVKACHGSPDDAGPDHIKAEFRYKVVGGELPPWFTIGLLTRQPIPGRVPEVGVRADWRWRPQPDDDADDR
jgi:hypothetical protein